MRQLLKELIRPQSKSQTKADSVRRIQTATSVLFLELAHCDDEFDSSEEKHIAALLKGRFNIDDSTIKDIIGEADRARKESADLWHFTHEINENFSNDEITLGRDVGK